MISMQDYISDIAIGEVQQYMKALFTALQTVHSYHIIHRDIKPSNFLYSRKERKYLLCVTFIGLMYCLQIQISGFWAGSSRAFLYWRIPR